MNTIPKIMVLWKLVDLNPAEGLEIIYSDSLLTTVTPSPLVYVYVLFTQILNFLVSVLAIVPLVPGYNCASSCRLFDAHSLSRI